MIIIIKILFKITHTFFVNTVLCINVYQTEQSNFQRGKMLLSLSWLIKYSRYIQASNFYHSLIEKRANIYLHVVSLTLYLTLANRWMNDGNVLCDKVCDVTYSPKFCANQFFVETLYVTDRRAIKRQIFLPAWFTTTTSAGIF
jgi:hypothetical protein